MEQALKPLNHILFAAPLLSGARSSLLLLLLAGEFDFGLGAYFLTVQGASAALFGLGFVCAGLGIVSLGLGETMPRRPGPFTAVGRLCCGVMGVLFGGLLLWGILRAGV